MRVLRTPEERFANLPGFPYEPRYADLPGGPRMAYVEAGPTGGEPVVLLHGEPSWSFLYRHVMRELAAAGLRAIAVDLVWPATSCDQGRRALPPGGRGLRSGASDRRFRDLHLACQDRPIVRPVRYNRGRTGEA
ncbi:haloalkane dehalogenase [Nonomuraea solani]|uniref:Haloalkane dehalogenase n=1 Tax=Nonomuraea solani TaxID=1144553 RepID=A0A1H6A1Q7_9ACTN|nr:hypothetical protein [Nonomuraea solani]SEG42381.1 haloalkane dehalogenase [Nonomuraea solani]